MLSSFGRNCPLVIAALSLSGCAHTAAAQTNAVRLGFGGTGLASIQYGGAEFLSNGDFSVQKVTLRDSAGHNADAPTSPINTTFDATQHKIKRVYPWGAVSCIYAASGNQLNLTIGVQNTSSQTLSGIWLQAMEVKFPQTPQGWAPNYIYMGTNVGSPTVNYANYGTGALVACNTDVTRPLLSGFPGRSSTQVRPLWVCSSNIGWLSPMLDPYINRPIAPGSYDTYTISIRFGSPAAHEKELASDIYAKYAKTYPQTLQWTDHRSVGALFLSTSDPAHHSAKNPRGWFLDPNLDATSPDGAAAFKQKVLDYADNSIKVLKGMNAQGMITWDIEGQEYPHATSYIGDPRLVKTLAPEMDAVADAYFKKFKDTGLKTGLCVRPQQLLHTAEKTEQQDLTDPVAIANLLYAKIAYANKRWGCTMFYVDSNGDPNVPFDPAIFKSVADKLAANKVQVMLMPEHQSTRYYAYTAPYDELRQNVTNTPDLVNAVYPQAFSMIYTADGSIDANHDKLVAAVKHGDILLFRGWYDDPQNAQVKKIYTDAGMH